MITHNENTSMNSPSKSSTPAQAPGPFGVYDNPLYLDPFAIGGIEIRPIDMLEHLLITGGTGSGKTRSMLLPLVEKTLRRFGSDAHEKAGMFLMDAKGDMSRLAVECARRAGREDDVYILGEGGNCWFPLFDQFDGDATRIANFLFEILEDRTSKGGLSKGGSNETFWEENARRLLRASVSLAKGTHGPSLGGLTGIANSVNEILSVNSGRIAMADDDDEAKDAAIEKCKEAVDDGLRKGWLGDTEHSEFKAYLNHDVKTGNDRTWSTIANMTRNYLAQFSQPALRRIFEPDPAKKRISPEDIIDQGALLIVSLSPIIYGEASAPFRVAVKKAFCERILQRDHLCIMEGDRPRRINQKRPVLFVCDEFHTTLHAGQGGEAYFLDRAREFRCMCMLATQGISAIQSVLASLSQCDHLLNNCRTKVFFANDCPATSEYFERIGGQEDRKVESMNYSPRLAPARFRLPNHEFNPAPAMRRSSLMIDSRRLPKFSAAELRAMPNGTALVVSKGDKLAKFTNSPLDYALATTMPGMAIKEDSAMALKETA